MAQVIVETLTNNLNVLIRTERVIPLGFKEDMESLVMLLSRIFYIVKNAERKQFTNKKAANWLRLLKDAAYDASDAFDDWSIEAQQVKNQLTVGGSYSSFLSDNEDHATVRIQIRKQIDEILFRFDSIADVDEHVWKDSEIWTFEVISDPIPISFRMSYIRLPVHVRQCFAYCSIFPKGYEMKKEELFHLWIANDFLVAPGGWKKPQMVFDVLMEQSFFENGAEDSFGDVVACKMQDRMHDLASFIMLGECSVVEVGKNSTVIENIRHLSLICESPPLATTLDLLSEILPSLRTLLFFQSLNPSHHCTFDISSLSRFRCLRALNMRDMSVEVVPSSVCYLKHLRYLNLSKNHIISLPESIYKLRNLQMLDVSENKGITRMPLSIGGLQSLSYLNLSRCSLTSLPEVLCNLTNLQMLDVSENEGITTVPVAISDLQSLRHLNLSRCSLTSLAEAISNMNLHVLDVSGNEEITTDEIVVNDLQSLRYLNLSRCLLTALPESILIFRNLEMLDLSRNYSFITVPFSIDRLRSLRYLNLSDCNRLQLLPESVCHLTKLQSLILSGCSSLGDLPETMRNMTRLKHIDIQGCRDLIRMPDGIGQLTSLQTLNLFVVGKPDRDRRFGAIKELQELNQLTGELEIKALENVRNSEDARQANLRNKYHLEKLKLSWGDVSSWKEGDTNNALEGLQLPPNTRQLVINEYPWTACFPQKFFDNLNGLQSLQIYNCKEMVCLPEGLQMLTSLEELELKCCNTIKCLPVMGMKGLNASLVSLTIEACDSLTSVSKGLTYLTSLKTLSFQSCPELELEMGDFQHLVSLQYLRIGWLPKLRDFPEGIKRLTMLESLEIECCWNLRRLPEGLLHLTSLLRLKIRYCPELQMEKEDFRCLISLQTFEVEFLPKLRSFPEGMQRLTMLQNLKIFRCMNLRMLPEGLKYLTGLQSLEIRNCHQDLHRRCVEEKGEDWHFISHISNLHIDRPLEDSSTSVD